MRGPCQAGPVNSQRKTQQQESCRGSQIAQLMSPRGITRVCLTLTFDRFLSHAPVAYEFLAPVLYYKVYGGMCQKKYTAKGGQHVHKVLPYVNLNLSFLNTHNVPLRKRRHDWGGQYSGSGQHWLIFPTILFSNIHIHVLSNQHT